MRSWALTLIEMLALVWGVPRRILALNASGRSDERLSSDRSIDPIGVKMRQRAIQSKIPVRKVVVSGKGIHPFVQGDINGVTR
jgi:hypothetical protein